MNRRQMYDRAVRILGSYNNGMYLQGGDYEFVLDILKQHPRASQKIGGGVRHIGVSVRGVERAFFLKRVDGTRSKFSLRKCLHHRPRGTRGFFVAACRRAVRPQVMEYKRSYFRSRDVAPCQLSGALITIGESVVHHEVPFRLIVEEFVQSRGLDVERVEYQYDEEGGMVPVFADERLAEEFREHHRTRAMLLVVSGKYHKENGL